jgi:hypothetical protein
MGDLNYLQSALSINIVDNDSKAVVTGSNPSGSEEALVVRNIPSGLHLILQALILHLLTTQQHMKVLELQKHPVVFYMD